MRLSVLDSEPDRPELQHVLTGLRETVRGEVDGSLLTRGLFATDASPYEVVPLAVVSPRDAEDLAEAVAWCHREGVPVVPRGAGTSLAGQTVNVAVVLDCSRHLHGLREVDVEARTAWVEPGLVLDDLRRRLAPLGLGFGPDVSTSTHATLGGMIGNSSAGSGSLVHGMTDEHVLAIDAVFADGTTDRLSTHPVKGDPSCRAERLASALAAIVRPLEAEIRSRFPKVPRNVGGYRLDDVLETIAQPSPRVELARFLSGSEGTLAVTAAAKVRLVELPTERTLLMLAFPDVASACARVPELVGTGAAAVELMDAFIIEAAADQAVFRDDVALLPTVDGGRPGAVLYVEYQGRESGEASASAHDAAARLGLPVERARVVGDAGEQRRLWSIRTTGLGLISKPDGPRQPMPGLEDCGVPLESLPRFQREFDALIRGHGWEGVFYAHASVGLLHVRPRIDLSSRADRDAFLDLRRETLELVRAHGGSISGEHGDGRIRGDLVAGMYGYAIDHAFGEVRRLFDPTGILNPGNKTGDRSPLDDLRVDRQGDPPAGAWFYRWGSGGPLEEADRCNGNALCRRHDGGAMCPSYRALLDENHSTRGRANALRLALGGRLGGAEPWGRPDVEETLSLCLSCKACRHECPSNVDLGKLKSEYLAQSTGGRASTLRHRLLGRAGLHIRRAARWRTLSRLAFRVPGVRAAMVGLLGLDSSRPVPRPAARDATRPGRRHAVADAPIVALLEDCFTASLEPSIVDDAARVLDAFGWRVVHVRLEGCCGRPQISQGLLEEARGLVRGAATSLDRRLTACDAQALVVLEPSCLSALQDEWRELETDVDPAALERIATASVSLEGFLESAWSSHPRSPSLDLPAGVVVHQHCHAKLERSIVARLLERCGADGPRLLDSGCCGMAGSFGHLAENAALSRRIYAQSLGDRLPEAGELVAAGTSCRQQCHDVDGRDAIHPATLLARSLGDH